MLANIHVEDLLFDQLLNEVILFAGLSGLLYIFLYFLQDCCDLAVLIQLWGGLFDCGDDLLIGEMEEYLLVVILLNFSN